MIRATSRNGMVVLLRNGFFLTALTPRGALELAEELEAAAGAGDPGLEPAWPLLPVEAWEVE